MQKQNLMCLFVFSAIVGLSCREPACAAEDHNQDKAAIRALVAKINQAWRTPAGPNLMREVLSDASFTVALPAPTDPTRALVFNKETFCAAFERLMRENPPRERSHDTTHIMIDGPIAYEFSRISMLRGTAPRQTSEHLNVFAKETDGWRLVAGVSMDGIHRALAEWPADENEEKTLIHLANKYLGVARTENPTPLAEVSEMLSDDFVQVTSAGRVYRGKAANADLIRKSVAAIASAFSRLDVSMDVESVQRLPGTAIVFGKITMTGRRREGNHPFQREIWETIVFEKEGSRWMMTREHSTLAAKPDAKE